MAKTIKKAMSRSEIMSKVKGKNTSIEKKLRKQLWSKGVRYRKNCRDVFGTPDICLKRLKIAIFCDSEFWHGKRYLEGKSIPKTNTDYWIEKFERNIKRDKEVNDKLQAEGWTVLRFWQKEIEQNIDSCIDAILKTIEMKKKIIHRMVESNSRP